MLARKTMNFRLAALWAGFCLATAATGFAVLHLYQTAQKEIQVRSEHAVEQAKAAAQERAGRYTEEVRISIISELAGFHTAGLAAALRQWDNANDVILGTFLLEPTHGNFAQTGEVPSSPSKADLATLIEEFRRWRSENSTTRVRDPQRTGRFEVSAMSTVGNPALGDDQVRYQGENLALLRDAGGKADPWACVAVAVNDATAPWIFWYAEGTGVAVRGCFVDASSVLQNLRAELGTSELAKLRIVRAESAATSSGVAINGLPGYVLEAEAGEVFLKKQADAKLSAAIAALLFALFVAGGTALAIYTRNETREAAKKITFVTQVSHELRTPLTSIRMFAEILQGANVPDEKRLKHARTIGEESARLGRLIERLLTFNTLQRNEGVLLPSEAVDVGETIRAVAAEMEGLFTASGIKVEIRLHEQPLLARSEAGALKQTLINLLDNACKYAPGTGTLQITTSTLKERIHIRVTDSGPGIPPEIRKRLFEPFVQGGQALTNKTPGVGLGLSLSRGLLRQTGGDLVHIATVHGTVFEIQLHELGEPHSPKS